MKSIILIVALLGMVVLSNGQITFNGAHPLFDDQNFILSFEAIDDTGRNSYITAPIDGNQPCSGVGVCELKIAWNKIAGQWEMLADDGNGGFVSPFLIFKNTEASKPNPPSLNLGTWEVNTDLLDSDQVGGSLTTQNTILTGSVQDSALNVTNQSSINRVLVRPNPVGNTLYIETHAVLNTVDVYDMSGKLILEASEGLKKIDVSTLPNSLYFLKIESENFTFTKKKLKK